MNEYFSSVFTTEDISSLPVPFTKFEDNKSEHLGQLKLSPVNNVTLFELHTIFVEACVLWARNPMFPVPSGWAGCHRYLRSIKDNLMNLTQK